MVKKNYSCQNSDSCSLVSVTGITANTSSESSNLGCCNDTHYTKSSHMSSSKHSKNSVSSHCSTSEEHTYSDCTTHKTTDTKSCLTTSVTRSSSHHDKVKTDNSLSCEPMCATRCHKLVKKYTCAKDDLLAFSDIIVVLNFIKNKLLAVQPNIDLRRIEKYSVEDNIAWLECFVDTLFCVLRKNESYKIINVKDCKLKNDSEIVSDNRVYLIKIKYCIKSDTTVKNLPLVFRWSQLTNNDAKSYKAVLNYVITEIDNYIKGYQAASTIPFLC
jgi:hypothetical protein